ncbi:MAG: alpha/beta hydrolase [Acidimicrobiia bacterium]
MGPSASKWPRQPQPRQGSPAIVLLHGGVINRHMWGPVVDNLGDHYDCISVDLPAHGELLGDDFSVERSIAVVIDVLGHFEIKKAALVGLSLGGYIAQATAAAHPDHVDGLVLSGATINYTGWDGISTRFYGFLFPILSKPAMKAFAKKMTEDLGPELAGAVLAGGLSGKGGGQSLRRLPGVDYAETMRGFTGPIVVANGERDTQNRDGEERFLELFPHANCVVIEDAGHACALQQPVSFSNAVKQLMAVTT